MSKRFITSAAAIAVLLAGFGIYWRGRQHSEQKPLRMSMNADGQKRLAQSLVGFKKYRTELAPLFNQATKVETFRIRMAEYGKPPGKTISGYPIIATGPDKSGSFAARLGEIILDVDTYQMPGRDMKLCWFDPNVAFRLWEAISTPRATIYFNCARKCFPKIHVSSDLNRSQVVAL